MFIALEVDCRHRPPSLGATFILGSTLKQLLAPALELHQPVRWICREYTTHRLLAHGVAGYDRPALQDDYRLSVLWQIMTPVWQHAIGIPPVIWWNNLERIHLAVDDLDCRGLL